MLELLVIFGQCWGEPWYGKNAGRMEGLPTGLREDGARQLTAGLIRHVEGVGLWGFEIEFASYWDAEVAAGPTLEGDVHDAQHAVHAA